MTKNADGKMKLKGGCFWNTLMVIGVLCIIFFCLVITILIFEGGSPIQMDIVIFLVVAPILGGVLLYFANKHTAWWTKSEPAKTPATAGSTSKPAPGKFSFQENDILCMAVIYEGYLPQGHILDGRALAEEIMENAHRQGLPGEIKLTPSTVLNIKRANEAAYYAEGLEPKDELPQMLQETVNWLRTGLQAQGVDAGRLNVKEMAFKTHSNLVSTVWVGLMVMR